MIKPETYSDVLISFLATYSFSNSMLLSIFSANASP